MLINNLVIKILNKILETNYGSRNLLAQHADKTFALLIAKISISAMINCNGFLIAIDEQPNYDISIDIPLSGASYLINQDQINLYKQIKFNGDINLGRQLLEIFSNIHFNGIYETSDSPLKTFIINQLYHTFSSLKKQAIFTTTNSINSICEYLLYETQDLITHFEHDKFCDDVDSLKQKTDKLEYNISRLSSSNRKESK